jgi:hypothetical protein
MNSIYLGFLKQLLIFSLILAIIVFIISKLIPAHLVSPALPFLLPLFIAVNLIVYYILQKTGKNHPAKFINRLMILTMVKLIFFILLIIAYMLLNPPDKVPFVGAFLLLYVCYTIFEVKAFISLNNKTRS